MRYKSNIILIIYPYLILGPSYLLECANKQSDIRLCVNKEATGSSKILTARVFSRHSGSKAYRVYIKYKPQLPQVTYDLPYNPEYIQSWYCECKNGARTLGSCCHVASIILFCAFERFLEKPEKPGQHLLDIFPSSVRDLEEPYTQTQTQTEPSETQTENQTNTQAQTQTRSKQVKRKGNCE